MDISIARLSQRLAETAERHHAAEKRLPEHDWNDWYAAYMYARQVCIDPGGSEGFADEHVRSKLVRTNKASS